MYEKKLQGYESILEFLKFSLISTQQCAQHKHANIAIFKFPYTCYI